ncbi:gamma-butyrobetaine hydroxylase-like domain-containing protein [Acidocella sp.]|uniref:gamma-butyrobetaine hydroxylase-like domain-containing protein n=1 Tax=Acidocella sp. TaxID=50710 RepID=UPI0026264213|nr:gamma-butyrobetaine hydroxylase-like domain-containing protein [Acidocella sp.]
MSAPLGIRVRRLTHRLELTYEDGRVISLPAELLRVFPPASPGQSGLIGGKRLVSLVAAAPVGTYALRLQFSDGFDSGIYSWDLLAELGREQNIRWRRYLRLLEEAGLGRD